MQDTDADDEANDRCGVCNVFMASEPLAGRHLTKVSMSCCPIVGSLRAEAFTKPQHIPGRMVKVL